MLSKTQFTIIDACADDYEIFYILFADVNFGGQVFERSIAPEDVTRYKDQGPWVVTVKSTEIVKDIIELVLSGLLHCRKFDSAGHHKILTTRGELETELEIYSSYECITFEDHVARFGYGPHDFYPSEAGRKEIGDSKYDIYC